jgi:hypothetical protein
MLSSKVAPRRLVYAKQTSVSTALYPITTDARAQVLKTLTALGYSIQSTDIGGINCPLVIVSGGVRG